jgi:acetolactate synthase I/II/III large subunit
MAREKADAIIIVLKNDAYAILNLEMARVREREMNAKMNSMLDLSNPSLDWVSIATGLGVPATRAGTTSEFRQHFEAALGAKGPRLIECQIATPKEWFALEEYIHRTR